MHQNFEKLRRLLLKIMRHETNYVRNLFDYAGSANLCARSPITRVHNRMIQPSPVRTTAVAGV